MNDKEFIVCSLYLLRVAYCQLIFMSRVKNMNDKEFTVCSLYLLHVACYRLIFMSQAAEHELSFV